VTPRKSISQSKSKAQRFDGVGSGACGEPVATAMIHTGPDGVPQGPRTPLDLSSPPLQASGKTPFGPMGAEGLGGRASQVISPKQFPRSSVSSSVSLDKIYTKNDPPVGSPGEPKERRFIDGWKQRVVDAEDRELRYTKWVSFIKDLDQRVGFDWWVTLTFRGPVHPESALKCLGRWEHKINRKVYGVRYGRRGEGISSIVAIEYQKRGVLHFHALTAGTKLPARRGIVSAPPTAPWIHLRKDGVREFRRMTAMDSWNDLAGIARIYPFRRGGGG